MGLDPLGPLEILELPSQLELPQGPIGKTGGTTGQALGGETVESETDWEFLEKTYIRAGDLTEHLLLRPSRLSNPRPPLPFAWAMSIAKKPPLPNFHSALWLPGPEILPDFCGY
jgi:hypothetical protein